MAIHKLLIDDFVSIDYGLIAIHSSLEDHRLAYYLNRDLQVLLEKCPKDISVKMKAAEGRFSRFTFEDPEDELVWNLIRNKHNVATAHDKVISLFGEEGLTTSTSVYLIPELKKTDYILKIENMPDGSELNDVIETLLGISHVTTAYKIDHHKLKSKNNLIF
jgi:hypothetical protein